MSEKSPEELLAEATAALKKRNEQQDRAELEERKRALERAMSGPTYTPSIVSAASGDVVGFATGSSTTIVITADMIKTVIEDMPAETKVEEEEVVSLSEIEKYQCPNCEDYFVEDDYISGEAYALTCSMAICHEDDEFIFDASDLPLTNDYWKCGNGCYIHEESSPSEWYTYYVCPNCEAEWDDEDEARNCCT